MKRQCQRENEDQNQEILDSFPVQCGNFNASMEERSAEDNFVVVVLLVSLEHWISFYKMPGWLLLVEVLWAIHFILLESQLCFSGNAIITQACSFRCNYPI